MFNRINFGRVKTCFMISADTESSAPFSFCELAISRERENTKRRDFRNKREQSPSLVPKFESGVMVFPKHLPPS